MADHGERGATRSPAIYLSICAWAGSSASQGAKPEAPIASPARTLCPTDTYASESERYIYVSTGDSTSTQTPHILSRDTDETVPPASAAHSAQAISTPTCGIQTPNDSKYTSSEGRYARSENASPGSAARRTDAPAGAAISAGPSPAGGAYKSENASIQALMTKYPPARRAETRLSFRLRSANIFPGTPATRRNQEHIRSRKYMRKSSLRKRL